jgi:hypothetical protein
MALTAAQFAKKAKDGSLTVLEAIDFALERPKINKSNKTELERLRKGWSTRYGFDDAMTLADMRDEKNYTRLLKSANPSNTNVFGKWAALERNLSTTMSQYGLSNVKGPDGEKLYPRITGGEGVTDALLGELGSPQRVEMGGTREMEGLLPQADIEKIYDEAIPEMRAKHGDVVGDVAEYHKATFQRPEQLVKGSKEKSSAILKSNVSVGTDYVEVKGVSVGTGKGKKTRPTVRFAKGTPMADLVLRNLENSKSNYLFDTNFTAYNKAFRETVTPRLMPFEDVLPFYDKTDPGAGRLTTPAVVRHMMSKMAADELKYPDDVIEGMMGHTNANNSTFRKHYAGKKPVEGLGAIINNLSVGEVNQAEGFGGNVKGGFTVALTEDEQRKLAAAKVARAEARAAQYKSEALETNRKLVEFHMSEEGQKLLEDSQRMQDELLEVEKQKITRDVELKEFEKQEKARVAKEATAAPAKPEITEGTQTASRSVRDYWRRVREPLQGKGVPEDVTTDMDDPDAPKKGKLSIGTKIAASIPLLGAGATAYATTQDYESRVQQGESPGMAATKAGIKAVAEEVNPLLAVKDIGKQLGELGIATGKDVLAESEQSYRERLAQEEQTKRDFPQTEMGQAMGQRDEVLRMMREQEK